MTEHPFRLIVGITGATGAIYGIRLLEMLRESEVETHLVMSDWAARAIVHETDYTEEDVRGLAATVHEWDDQGAAISSGSFLTAGMIIAPCSMRTLSAIANGQGEQLMHRAADVVLKERRKLVLLCRETPLSDIHLENMLKLSRIGVVMAPPVPAFYNHPKTLDDIVNHTVARALDQFGIHVQEQKRWTGMAPAPQLAQVALRARRA